MSLDSGMKVRALIAVAALMLLSCATSAPRIAPAEPISVEITPVLLDPRDPDVRSIGSFTYAGGIEIKALGGTILELSDLRIVSGDRLVAVSDTGYFFEARMLFDGTNRLSGLADARMTPLLGERGEPLIGRDADAEGLDLLPDGGRLVSFEGNHRIWRYSSDGTGPRPVPRPNASFPNNEGMEALVLYPPAGPDAYLVGSEGGTIWLCRLSATCSETQFGALVPPGFGLTALSPYGNDAGFVMLSRTYDPLRGVRMSVKLIATGPPGPRVLDEMTMAPPLTVDNFEGLSVVPGPDGSLRLYLVSDDNGSTDQRTYLLAFDWRPAR
jgi:hypothetical protein